MSFGMVKYPPEIPREEKPFQNGPTRESFTLRFILHHSQWLVCFNPTGYVLIFIIKIYLFWEYKTDRFFPLEKRFQPTLIDLFRPNYFVNRHQPSGPIGQGFKCWPQQVINICLDAFPLYILTLSASEVARNRV